MCACIGKDTVVKFVSLCFVCDLYSVPARIQPRPCRPVVYCFVQWSLQANELSYESTVRFHWPPRKRTTPWDNAYLWFPDLRTPFPCTRACRALLLVGADGAS